MSPQTPFTDVPDAIEEIRAGRMIVVVDDEDRENEGDLTLAAEKVTPEAINFMARFGRGLVCLAMTEERLEHLNIGPMTSENTSQFGTAFCEAIDARTGVTTGISAHDRARTIQVAIDPATKPVGFGASRTHVPSSRPQRRSAGARRPDRSLGRSGAACRHGPRGNHLRNHEGRWQHGARAGPDRVLPRAQDEDAHRRRADPLPHVARALRASRGRGLDRHALWRVPHDRLRERSGWRRVARGAGSRRH